MSDVETHTDMAAFEADMDRPTIHSYPRKLPYRRSGMSPPQPGDVARCGHVKVRPPSGKYLGAPVTCEGCRTLKGLS